MIKMMKQLGMLVMAFVVGAGCATTGNKVEKPIVATDETPKALFDAGERALLAQQNENAKNLFLKGLALQPDNDAAKVGLSDAYIRLGLLGDARSVLEEQYGKQPDSRRIIGLLGQTYQENKDTAVKGLKMFEGLYEKNDRDELVLNQLAGLHRVAGNYDKSVAMCKRILERHPESVAALKTLSFTYFESGKYTLAETIAVNVIEKGDKDPVLYNNRGMIRVYKKQYLKAQPFFQKALELNPKMNEAHLNLGAISLRYRDYETAEKHFGAVLKNDSRHPSANLGLGFAMGGLQKGEEAIKQLEKALEITPESVDVLAEITVIYKLQMQDLDNALLWANKYVAAKGGTLADSDPMKIQLDNIKMEIEGAKMAAEAMAESEAEEAAAAAAAAEAAAKEDAAAEDSAAEEGSAQEESSEAPEAAPVAEEPGAS